MSISKHIISEGKQEECLLKIQLQEKKYIYSRSTTNRKNRKYYAHYRITIKNWETNEIILVTIYIEIVY